MHSAKEREEAVDDRGSRLAQLGQLMLWAARRWREAGLHRGGEKGLGRLGLKERGGAQEGFNSLSISKPFKLKQTNSNKI